MLRMLFLAMIVAFAYILAIGIELIFYGELDFNRILNTAQWNVLAILLLDFIDRKDYTKRFAVLTKQKEVLER